ncbi:hypothetical protein DKX38_029220 [Salix brachista]|uniref:Uncharacterized protein n=1 Tax=Salix brachista TaxID=2182728 RepID=A0A5N5J068_9ROSI|nr:hypothetical protein DKX38_029220 [Salix brachista]
MAFGTGYATFKNKSNGIKLFRTLATVTFDRNSTKHSWIQSVPLIGLEESLQGVEELELNVDKWDPVIDLHALGSSTTDDQRLESSLIRELQKWEITGCIKRSVGFES